MPNYALRVDSSQMDLGRIGEWDDAYAVRKNKNKKDDGVRRDGFPCQLEGQHVRTMQRNPKWQVDVSTPCAMRAAGR